MAFVYWIHLPEHTDITSEGYIGFTSKTVATRFRQHKLSCKRGSKYHLYNAMRKYGDKAVIETLLEGPDDYCLDVENKLRPTPKIGWNSGVGGENTMRGYQHSEESKANMSASSATKGKKLDREYVLKRAESRKAKKIRFSDETKEKISKAHLARKAPPWKNPAAVQSNWAKSLLIADGLAAGKIEAQLLREFGFGCRSTALSIIIRKIKSGWNPSEDEAYLEWLRQYKQEELNETPLAT